MRSMSDVIRGLARAAFRSKRLSRMLDSLVASTLAPNAFAQLYAERHFWRYCGIEPADVRLIVDVGANEGWEADRFLVQYPNVQCLMFEADPQQYQLLSKRFSQHQDRVKCYQNAVSDRSGVAEFYSTVESTSGSLLPVVDNEAQRLSLTPKDSFKVDCVTLDEFFAAHPEMLVHGVDLLWADVQGAELAVLKGADRTLEKCRAVFMEVWTGPQAYVDACSYSEIRAFLEDRGFLPAIVGIPPQQNVGDALWVRAN